MNDSTWTWFSGRNTIQTFEAHDLIGNVSGESPGARMDAVGWYDSLREEFWLFGGSCCKDTSALPSSTNI